MCTLRPDLSPPQPLRCTVCRLQVSFIAFTEESGLQAKSARSTFEMIWHLVNA